MFSDTVWSPYYSIHKHSIVQLKFLKWITFEIEISRSNYDVLYKNLSLLALKAHRRNLQIMVILNFTDCKYLLEMYSLIWIICLYIGENYLGSISIWLIVNNPITRALKEANSIKVDTLKNSIFGLKRYFKV